MSELQKTAAKERMMKLDPEERSARAQKMAQARWGKTSPKERKKFVKDKLVKNQSRFKKKD